MSCGVGRRCGSDLVLLWLCCRPAASAPIGLLAWEPPYVEDVALKRQKRQKKFENFFFLGILTIRLDIWIAVIPVLL